MVFVPGIAQLLCVYLPLIWVSLTVIYRRYFHPLRHVPGPWLASVTWLYEYYYDLWLGGQSSFRLIELHRIYGPIIRLNPDEVHINDPAYYDQVFNARNGPVEKPFKHAHAFGPYQATLGTIDHNLHKARRAAISPFFSRRSVLELMPYTQTVLENLCQRFEDIARSGTRVNLRHAYAALIVDIVEEYSFSRRSDRTLMPDFGARIFDNIDRAVEFALGGIHLAWLIWPIYYLPDWLMRKTSPAMADMIEDRNTIYTQVKEMRLEEDVMSGHRTVFHELASSNLPAIEKRPLRLRDEAFVLSAAATGSTSIVLKTITYHITANPAVRRRLFADLKTIMPARDIIPSLVEVEKLDYLVAIVQEGFRVTHAISHRLLSQFPQKDLIYDNLVNGKKICISAGTIIGMTSMIHHENNEIFPNPKLFRPERWLDCDETQKREMLKALTPFGRGNRSCLGLNLAMAQIYMTLAVVFRRFEFDISAVVKERDIDTSSDFLLTTPRKDSKGVIVGIKLVQS